MIVLRYARNLAEGNGLVYNLGERVMGFTTPLFTVLSALFVGVGGAGHAAAWQNGFGILCMLGTAALAARLLVRTGAGAAAPLAVALVTFNPEGTYNYVHMGMEIHLFAFLFLLAVDLHLSQRNTAACVVAALLFLTRPEGVLLAGMLVLAAWQRERRLPIRQSVACLLTVAPWLLFATLYYGSPVPATLPAKAGTFILHLPDYLRFVGSTYADAARSLVATLTPPSLAALPWAWFPVATLVVVGCSSMVRRRPATWPLVAFPVVAALGYGAIGTRGNHTWHYYTLNVLFAIALAHGACTVASPALRRLGRAVPRMWARLPPGKEATFRASTVVLLLALAAPIFLSNWVQANYRAEIGERRHGLAGMGRALEERFDSDTSVLVDEIGHIGWNSSLRILDMAGLVTPGLRFDVPRDVVVERHRPDLLLLHDDAPTRHLVMQTHAFPRNQGYAEVRDFPAAPGYRLWRFKGTDAMSEHAGDPYRVLRGASGHVEALVQPGAKPLDSPRRFAVVPPGNGPTGFFESTSLQSPLTTKDGASFLAVEGWAANASDPTAVPEVVIVSGDRAVAAATPGVARPDVAAQLGLATDRVGFRFTAAADVEHVRQAGMVGYALSPDGIASPLGYFHEPLTREAGREILPVTDGRRLIVRQVGGGFDGMVDQVATVDGQTVVKGWAADTEGGVRPRKLVVYRNGQFVVSFDAGVHRPDVADLPGDSRLGATGFRVVAPGGPRPDRFGRTHRVFALFDREGAAVELPTAGAG